MSPVTVLEVQFRADVQQSHVAADARDAHPSVAAVSYDLDLAADGLRFELSAPDFGADAAADRLQPLGAAHAFNRLLSADRVDRHGAALRHAHEQIARSGGGPAARQDHFHNGSRAFAMKLEPLDAGAQVRFDLHFGALPADDMHVARDVDDFHLAVCIRGRALLDLFG